MKRCIMAVAIIVFVLFIAGVALYDLSLGVNRLLEVIDEIKEIPEDQIDLLTEKSLELRDKWEKEEEHFVLYINHGTLMHISQLANELPELARHGSTDLLFSKIDAMNMLVNDLLRDNIPSYRNML